MSVKIDQSLVRHIAHLSRLTLRDEEADTMAHELSAIVDYIELLNELDTDGVPPASHAIRVHNVFRDDRVEPSLDLEAAMRNAPWREKQYFRVPKVLEGDGA